MTCLEEDTCPARKGDDFGGGRAGRGSVTCCIVFNLVIVDHMLCIFNEMIYEFDLPHGRWITVDVEIHRMIGIIKPSIIIVG